MLCARVGSEFHCERGGILYEDVEVIEGLDALDKRGDGIVIGEIQRPDLNRGSGGLLVREGLHCCFALGFVSGRDDQPAETKAQELCAAVETEPGVAPGNDGRLAFEINIGRGDGRWRYSKLSPEKINLAGLLCR